MRVRQTSNKLWIPRPNIQIENELDKKYERSGKLEWEIPEDQMPTVLKPTEEKVTPLSDKRVNQPPVTPLSEKTAEKPPVKPPVVPAPKPEDKEDAKPAETIKD